MFQGKIGARDSSAADESLASMKAAKIPPKVSASKILKIPRFYSLDKHAKKLPFTNHFLAL